MAKRREDAPTSRPPLTLSQRDFLFAYLLNHEDLFSRAALQITDECFADDERWLRLLWQIAREHRETHNELPGKEMLATRVSSELELDSELLTDDDLDELQALLDAAFGLDDQPSYSRTAATWLQHFLEDRLMQKVRQELSLPHTPDQMADMFTQLANVATEIRSVSESGIEMPFPDGWDETDAVVETTTTGLSFLDSFMGGGDARGEVYGLVAPFGGGKTTISVQITVEKARRAYLEWINNGRQGTCGRAYHFAYEDPIKEVRARALTALAQIPMDRLNNIVGRKAYNELSVRGHYRDYEREKFRDVLAMGEQPPAERERYDFAIQVLNHCWRYVYMGATPEHPRRGTQLVDEVAALIKQDLAHSPHVRPDVVLTDYVLAAARRHLDSVGRGYDQMRHFVVGWPSALRHKVAMPFNCPAWAMQQLNAKANKIRPGLVQSSLESGEGGGFPENCNFCFAIGKLNRENYATFSCDKHRRQGNGDAIVVYLNGNMAAMEDVRLRYTIDPRTNSILSRNDASRLGIAGRDDGERRDGAEDPSVASVRSQQGLGGLVI